MGLGQVQQGCRQDATLIDLRRSIPAFISISDGRKHDSKVLDEIDIVRNAIYAMDKAYVAFKALARFDAEEAYFVLRAKTNMKYEIVSSNFNFDPNTGVHGDHIIRLTGYKSRKDYPKDLRLIEFCDRESGEELQFITNITDRLELNGLELANIYRHQWDIESFFKLIKGNLIVKHLLGCSENAVKTHLWIAIIAYLLLARIKALYKSPYSITEIGTMVKVYGLMKMDLRQLVTEPQPLILNQDVNEPSLF